MADFPIIGNIEDRLARVVQDDAEGLVIQLDLNFTRATEDWIRSSRLANEGKQDEVDKLDSEMMVK